LKSWGRTPPPKDPAKEKNCTEKISVNGLPGAGFGPAAALATPVAEEDPTDAVAEVATEVVTDAVTEAATEVAATAVTVVAVSCCAPKPPSTQV